MFVHTSTPVTFDFGQDFDQSNVIYTGDEELDLFVFLGTPKQVLDRIHGGHRPQPRAAAVVVRPVDEPHHLQERSEVRDVAKKLREHRIPGDVIHLDTGWFETDWQCDFKFAKSRFADPAKMMSDLKQARLPHQPVAAAVLHQQERAVPETIVEKGYFVKNAGGQLPVRRRHPRLQQSRRPSSGTKACSPVC